ncbi:MULTISPECIES: amidohydrolase family protein [unclassified Spirosoma]|uniref:metal-dependent hydrolase family protein n=1 Tax=unclassified Spirosoma TaxID=2621999 RepID=UPI00095CF552|nr:MULTISPECIES: amidohydrolase family protein [unclassified Spirosoma]MBN8826033.1 amidohydrolase family protein [Spirosoma sp.]OJW75486.1 MAG: amidohydrolase [Spirosoma sp. 48-14]
MKKIYLLAGLSLLAFPLFAQRTLIHCGNLFDGVGNSVQPQMTIVVEGNKITAVQKGYTAASSQDQVVDLKSKTVLPGLIDMHVHLETQTRRGGAIDGFTSNPADVAFRAARFAKTTLLAGFTTVRDLGGSGINVSLRNAINAGLVEGPRVLTAGKSIATTGGHADPTNGYRKDLMGDPGPEDGVINGPDDARKAVRQRYKDGSDLIKITATGGVLSNAKDGSGPQFTEEEAKAIVDAAKDYGFSVAAHAHGAEGMKRAIRAGVQTIEHGTFMDDETIELFKKHGTYFVPTIIAGKTVADSAKHFGYYTALVTPKALAIGPKIQATFAKAYKAGVKIAFGTDAGVFIHGYNAKEFEYMVEAGMPSVEAIKSALLTNAKLLNMDAQIGSIESGKFADIIAVDENPLQNIKTLQAVKFVMKDGKVYKQ